MVRGAPGLVGSIALHVAAGAAIWYLYKPKEEELPTEVAATVNIELVTLGDITNVSSSLLRQAPEPPVAAPPPELVPDDLLSALPGEETVDGDNTTPPPAPEPEPDPADAIPMPAKTDEDAKAAPETPKDPKRTPPQEPDPLADLLGESSNLFDRDKGKTRTRRADPPPGLPEDDDAPPAGSSEPPTRGAGDRTGATATIESLLLSQIKDCWDSVEDLPDPERLLVTVRVRLNTDGTLSGQPQLLKPSSPPFGDRPMSTAIQRALTATRTCAPYRLPSDSYDIWNEITLVIGPEPS